MDKHTLKNLICGKLWIWKVWDTVNVNYHERPAEFFWDLVKTKALALLH